jgi:hypothetical protein
VIRVLILGAVAFAAVICVLAVLWWFFIGRAHDKR